ncbi:MAG TPA: CoA transferase [Candidatus Bathyarchaeia archaeon]|nr:CoA transferase [Candidatus Bathyarchaeia archaeon]
MRGSLPLEDVKVVEIAQALAGPFAGEILAHMGADVVKVERPEGDEARGWGPPFTMGGGPTFHAVNMNKRSIVLDLKDPQAIRWLKGYIAQADVVVQNLRPGVIEELGLGPDVLMALNPRLVFCSLWAFGRTGPRRLRPGYEPMVQAFAGLFSVNGGEEDPPSRFGAPVLDLGTGMWAAMGVLAALHQRARTGRGCVVDASLFETAMGWLTGHISGHRFTGDLPSRERTGSRRLVPFQGFQTKNGTVIIAAGNDRLFAKLGAALGHPEWAADPRFVTNAERRAHREELVALMEAVLTTRTKGEWIDILEEAGVPCAPIQDLREMLAEPQVAALGVLQAVPDLGHELMTLPVSFDGQRPPIRRRAPTLGEHTGEIVGPSAP